MLGSDSDNFPFFQVWVGSGFEIFLRVLVGFGFDMTGSGWVSGFL